MPPTKQTMVRLDEETLDRIDAVGRLLAEFKDNAGTQHRYVRPKDSEINVSEVIRTLIDTGLVGYEALAEHQKWEMKA